jgi:hypothetical protein
VICSPVMTWDRARRGHRSFALIVPLLAACGASKPLGDVENDPMSVGGSSATGGSSASGGTGTGGNGATGGSIAAVGGSSATGGASTTGGSGGAGAMAGVGGASAAGGSGAMSGAGGSVATGGTGGSTGGAAGAGGSAGAAICQELSVVPTPQVPTVLLLVDNSSSMFETMPPAWPLLYTALMDETMGVVKSFESKVRFGFAAYKGSTTPSAETAPACATWAKVGPALDNFAAIDAVYKPIAWPIDHPKWETPTGHAINMAAADLAAYMPDPPGPKFILLVTDGNPNTCLIMDPQCGQDLSIKAAQDAYAQGIGLFAMGIGDIVAQPNAGCPTAARCGQLHLQDLANAGVGAPVQPTPGCDDPTASGCTFKHESCNQDQTLKATYTPAAPDVGTPFSVDTRNADATAELVSTLNGLLANVISCTVEMDAIVAGNPALGTVTVGGTPVAYGDANGWSLDMVTKYNVTLEGAACETFKGGAELHISFPCDPSGNPIAVRR